VSVITPKLNQALLGLVTGSGPPLAGNVTRNFVLDTALTPVSAEASAPVSSRKRSQSARPPGVTAADGVSAV